MPPTEHKAFRQPDNPSIQAWRYMDLPKLLSMLMRRELHLTRLDRLEDTYEGTIPLHTRDAYRTEMMDVLHSPTAGPLLVECLAMFEDMTKSSTSPLDSPVTAITNFMLPLMRMGRAIAISRYEKQTGRRIDSPPAPDESPAEVEARKMAKSMLPAETFPAMLAFYMEHKRAPTMEELLEAGKPRNEVTEDAALAVIDRFVDKFTERANQLRRDLYVNCWHLDDIESEAMWRIYCGRNNGIAVVVPYSKLRESLSTPDTYIGEITYIKYNLEDIAELDLGCGYSLAMHKRKEFEHEKEARIVARRVRLEDRKHFESGLKLPWTPEDQIEKIIVSPYSDPWYIETVRSIITHLNPALGARVIPSAMGSDH
jgi:hypothetical protein